MTHQDMQLKTLMFTDFVNSTMLVAQLGDEAAASLNKQHDKHVRAMMRTHKALEIEKTDGFFLVFNTPGDAIRFAMDYHQLLAGMAKKNNLPLATRIGIMMGEIVLRTTGNNPQPQAEGPDRERTQHLMELATGSQTLITKPTLALFLRSQAKDPNLKWVDHGQYVLPPGEALEVVCEIGMNGLAPFQKPGTQAGPSSNWQPQVDQPIPGQGHWLLLKRLGTMPYGEDWLARHDKTGDFRLFKLALCDKGLSILKRETAVYRLLKEKGSVETSIARIFDWNFEKDPYYVEVVYPAEGNLIDWAKKRGGLNTVPLSQRLEIVAQLAETLDETHSLGVIHKNVRPTNVLVQTATDREIQVQLANFGTSGITNPDLFRKAGITTMGLRLGSLLNQPLPLEAIGNYHAPEIREGHPPSLQADIYALGVMMYQLVYGSFDKALVLDTPPEIDDPYLSEIITCATARNPQERWARGLLMAQALRRVDERKAEDEASQKGSMELKARLEKKEKAAQTKTKQLTWAVIVLALLCLVSMLAHLFR